jgi:hypothetical protein
MAERKSAAEKAQEAILADGRFAAQEDGDNAIDVSNSEYIGVSPEYQNSAYDTDKPIQADGDDPVADRAKASAEELSNLAVNRAGYTVPTGGHRAGRGVKVGDQPAPDPTENRGAVMTTPPQTRPQDTAEATTTTTTDEGNQGQ